MKTCNVEPHILLYAFRYALGRMTAAPSDVVDAIIKNIDCFDEWQKVQMVKEINEAEMRQSIGMECDRQSWEALKKFLNPDGKEVVDKNLICEPISPLEPHFDFDWVGTK